MSAIPSPAAPTAKLPYSERLNKSARLAQLRRESPAVDEAVELAKRLAVDGYVDRITWGQRHRDRQIAKSRTAAAASKSKKRTRDAELLAVISKYLETHTEAKPSAIESHVARKLHISRVTAKKRIQRLRKKSGT